VSLILLVDESPASVQATKLLEEAGLRFLTMRTPTVSVPEPPVLLADKQAFRGVEGIRGYVEKIGKRLDAQNERLGLTLYALKKLNQLSSLSTFNDRLRVQKVIYLLQYFGLPTKWNFSWYLRGPYAPDLTHALLDLNAGEIGKQEYKIATKAIENLRKRLNPEKMTAHELEAAASILYVAKEHADSLSQRAVVDEVLGKKPHLSRAMVESYVGLLWDDISAR
jgi:uncharacterized protein YwgA